MTCRARRGADYDPTLISVGRRRSGHGRRSRFRCPPRHAWPLAWIPVPVAISPDELISAILRAPVDLLWNGGDRHLCEGVARDACGRAEEPVKRRGCGWTPANCGRGSSPRAGNLGFTQAARDRGTRLTAGWRTPDFIDNSAGVDTSDHEVQHQDPAGAAPSEAARFAAEQRGELLHTLTDEIAAHVLRHNRRAEHCARAVARYQAPRAAPRALHATCASSSGTSRVVARHRRAARGGRRSRPGGSAGRRADPRPSSRCCSRTRRSPPGQEGARLRPARRPVAAVHARRVLPRAAARAVRRPARCPPAAPGDHHDLGDQRDGGYRRVERSCFRLGEETGLALGRDITRAWLGGSRCLRHARGSGAQCLGARGHG